MLFSLIIFTDRKLGTDVLSRTKCTTGKHCLLSTVALKALIQRYSMYLKLFVTVYKAREHYREKVLPIRFHFQDYLWFLTDRDDGLKTLADYFALLSTTEQENPAHSLD